MPANDLDQVDFGTPPESVSCPLCGLSGTLLLRGQGAGKFGCQRCGCYRLGSFTSVKGGDASLSAATRQAWERGENIWIEASTMQAVASPHRSSPYSDRLLMTLRYIAGRSNRVGESARLDLELDYPIADAGSAAELLEYLNYLVEIGKIRYEDNTSGTDCWVTIPGWESLQPKPQKGGTPGTCFVAMAFNAELDNAYENGILAAVKDCGFIPIRIDRVPHNDQITDRIMAGIRECQFMVADFTLQRNGVYYEAGFAKGLGRTVIHCCKMEEIEAGKLHFDTKIISHVAWTDPADLRMKLADRIKHTIIDAA